MFSDVVSVSKHILLSVGVTLVVTLFSILLNNSFNSLLFVIDLTFNHKSFHVLTLISSTSQIRLKNSSFLKKSFISSLSNSFGLNLKSSSSNFLFTTQSQAISSVSKCSSKFISVIIVANFLLKKALSSEFNNFSNVFHLKHD